MVYKEKKRKRKEIYKSEKSQLTEFFVEKKENKRKQKKQKKHKHKHINIIIK